ncbi:hypothetical protein C1H87_12690 [Flavivirga eckloniae]|uniref:Fibronectin type-III domain-containing protein n=2 Tax=Flavivirga eckloniae TaxID=1803846 RepID=A0A2K9PSJ7_9FLAO|nr:hypothetical protein C1H87_12690 [Flavivirga eckloniae]
MKTIYRSTIYLLAFALSISFSNAQEAPGAIAVEHGVFVYGGGKLPKNGYYLFERKGEKDRNYIEIAKTTVPSSDVETEKKAAENATNFKHLQFLNKQDVKRVYEYVLANKTDDSLYRAEHTPIIALTVGTAFLDTTVEKDKTYQYRIRLFKDGSEVFQKELNPIKNTVKTNLSKPKSHRSEIVNDAVFLEWIVDEQKDLTFFNVYRAFFGTLDFKKINVKKGYSNDENGLHLIAIDDSAEKASLYKYYIQPVDLYGNAGDVSEAVSIGKLQAENIIPIKSLHAEELSDYQIKLSWELDKTIITSNIKVMRSHNYDDGFVEVTNLPPTTSEFTDNLPEASENYYYYLVINGGTGQEFRSAKISAMVKTNRDVLPAPQDVSGEPMTDGIEISWEYSQPYTRGFYVFRATAEMEIFNQVSNLIPVNGKTAYSYKDLDTNLKAGEIYRYTVRAENDAYTMGKFSDTINVFTEKKPKMIVPQKVRAVFRDSIVEVVWKDMTKVSEYVLGYKVYRSEGKNSPLQVMPNDSLKPYKNYFNDANISNGPKYTYHIATLDMFGQESDLSLPVSVVINKTIENLDAPNQPKVYKNSKGITVSWNQMASKDVSEIKIYRSEGSKEAKAIKTLSITEKKYIDASVKKGVLYYYKISLVTKNGNESVISSEASIYF